MDAGAPPRLAVREKTLPNLDPFEQATPSLVDPGIAAVRFRYVRGGDGLWAEACDAGVEQPQASALLPRYQRRVREVNEAVVGTYLAGGNTRQIRSPLQPLLKAAPFSKSAVSRLVATLKDGLAAWMARSLAKLDIVDLSLDALPPRVRRAGKGVSVPVLSAVAVLAVLNARPAPTPPPRARGPGPL
jgi:hypothetical protein